MNVPKNLNYTKEHEWVRMEGSKAYIGITDYAQHSLGDIVFVELPEEGAVLKANGKIGVVESVKAVSDVFCPLSGKVLEINQRLIDEPQLVNEDPYESWIAVLEVSNPEESSSLLTPESYEEFIVKGK